MTICRTFAELWQFITVFQNGGCPQSLIYYEHVWTTHEEYFVVFMAIQNFVGIDALVSMTCNVDI